MKVKLMKLRSEARIPVKAHEGDFCYDVWAVSEQEIAPHVWKYGLGFALQIDREGVSNHRQRYDIDLRPRSSVWEHGMVLSNSVGTVDEGYRGEISMIFYHVLPEMPRYKVGDKIGQIHIGGTVDMNFVEVSSLEESERGAGGFGSTGLR